MDVSLEKKLTQDEKYRQLQAVFTEYNDCRNEIKIRIQQRTQMTQFYIVGIVGIIGYAIQGSNILIWPIAASYAVFMYTMILGTYFYTDSLANYIREEIESKKIPYLLGTVPDDMPEVKTNVVQWKTLWLGWETNFDQARSGDKSLKEHNLIRRKKVLHYFSWCIVLVSTVCMAYSLQKTGFETISTILLSFTAVLVFGLIIEIVSRRGYPGKRG